MEKGEYGQYLKQQEKEVLNKKTTWIEETSLL